MGNSTALLIIDVQEAMFSYPDQKLYDEEGVMERIISLQNKARVAGTPIVYIQHTEDEEYIKRYAHMADQSPHHTAGR